MSQSISAYIRSQGIGAAVPNLVINPAIAWAMKRRMELVPLTGDNSVLVDTAITSVVLTLIVTMFVASATRRDVEAGRVTAPESFTGPGLLSMLPRRGWALGLTLGIGAAVVLTSLTFGVFRLIGLTELPFLGFALFKAVYTPLLAFIVACLAVLRQLVVVKEV